MKAGLVAVLVFLLVAGWHTRFSIPNIALSDRDTWGYLSPALSWLGERGFQQEGGRDWFYPFLISGALHFGPISEIAVIQKLLGWAAGLLLTATWVTWVAFLPLRRTGCFLALLFGALPLSLQMFNPQILYFELQIRPEAVMPFFVYAQLFCLVAYCRYRWFHPRPVASIVFGAGTLVFAYLCFLLKPSWLFAAGATILPVFAGLLLGRQIKLPLRLAAAGAGLLAIILVAATPSRLPFTRNYESTTVLPQTLFCVHAALIKDQLQKRLARIPDSDPDKPRLQKVVDVLQREFLIAAQGSHNYEFLGYDPDYLRYRSQLIPTLHEYAHHSRDEFNAFCLGAYQETALANPFGMAVKVLTQYLHFLFPKPSTFLQEKMDVRSGHTYALESLPSTIDSGYDPQAVALLQQYRDALAAGQPAAPLLTVPPIFPLLMKHVAQAVLPIEIAFLLALILVHFRPGFSDLRLPAWVVLFLFSAPAGNALTVAVVHALDISRYRAGYGGFHFFALAAMAVFLAVVLERIFLQLINFPKIRKPTPWKT